MCLCFYYQFWSYENNCDFEYGSLSVYPPRIQMKLIFESIQQLIYIESLLFVPIVTTVFVPFQIFNICTQLTLKQHRGYEHSQKSM